MVKTSYFVETLEKEIKKIFEAHEVPYGEGYSGSIGGDIAEMFTRTCTSCDNKKLAIVKIVKVGNKELVK